MPTTRSDSSRSKTTGEATSSDWSMNTPSDSASTSASSRATLTAGQSTTGSHRKSPASQQRSTTAGGGSTTTQRDTALRAPPARTTGEGIKSVESAQQEGSRSTLPVSDRSKMEGLRRQEESTTKDASPITEGKNTQQIMKPPTKKPTREMDTQSARSSHRKRAEAQARMTVALRELEIAEAKSRVAQAELELIAAESEDEDGAGEEIYERTHEVEQWLIQTGVKPNEEQKPSRKENKSEIQELAEAIFKLSERTQEATAPRHIELPYFSGSSEGWLAFKRSFEDTAKSYSNTQNLARLRRSLQGRAKEAVQSLLFTAEDPQEILKGLEARFGRPGAIALAELEKLKSMPKVGEYPSDICVFASKVRNAVATIKALKKPQYLSSPETMKAIIEKMPSSMKFRWFAYHRSRREEDISELLLIEAFLEIEADMCGDFAPPEVPLESKKYPRSYESSGDQKKPIKRQVTNIQEATQEKWKMCPMCQEEHFLLQCNKFKEADIDEKWNLVKKAKICFKCIRLKHSRLNCKAPTCKKCGRWHHTMLHSDRPPAPAEQMEEKKTCCYTMEQDEDTFEEKVASIHNTRGEERAYLKMVPVDLYGPKGHARVLALLDEGSTITLLDSTIAKKIGAEGKQETLTIETIGGKEFKKSGSQKIKLKIKGAFKKDKKTIEARTIDNLRLSDQEVQQDTLKNCKHLEGIKEQLLYTREKPKLLIGQDNWGLIVTRRIRKGKNTEPVASLTSLGWVLHGSDSSVNTVVNFINHGESPAEEENIEEVVRNHFSLESMGIKPQLPSNDSDRRALEILEKNTKRLENGQFEAGLLWRKDNEVLPNNYNQAFRRLVNVEKKLDKDVQLKESYEKQIQTLLEKGYAEKAPSRKIEGRTFYLPHFAVIHPVKKKPRIVFDAAAKFEGRSLNDVLLPGPDLLQSLFGVLLRFREGPVAVMADIQDMFLRIKIREDDRDSLRFLWRGAERNRKPEEFRMTSVIFGAASSPATAIYVMNKNAEDFKEKYPEAVKAINRNHYMDDYLQSFTSASEAKRIATEVDEIHKKAGFYFKGWASNHPDICEQSEDNNKGESLQLTKEEKTLGLRWIVKRDQLAFNVGLRNTSEELLQGRKTPTKREITSAVMSTFDPLGFATPVLIQGKKLIQDVWRSKIDWDEKIKEEQKETWLKYLKEVLDLTKVKIPRCISPNNVEGQLHTFTDASEEAYAAAIYWRTVEPGGRVHISFIAGKARVTPTKPVSVPRLELQAALLGSRLAATIEREMNLKITKKTYWTDSSTVLQWIQADPRRFKTFVAHRLAEIEELTKPNDWRWVPTKENPADDATRGTPTEFDHSARWFRGPGFLREPEGKWPIRSFKQEETMLEEKTKHKVATVRIIEKPFINVERFSRWERLLHTMTRVITFVEILKKRTHRSVNIVKRKDVTWKPYQNENKKREARATIENKERKMFIPVEEEHLRRAEEILIKVSQSCSFSKEIRQLKEEKPLENSSRLKKIDIYMNEEGIIKLRSRTNKFKGRETNLVILDGKEKITRLIIEYYHRRFLHGNTATVMNEIRQKYWILGLRTTLKALIHKCQWCKTKKGSPAIPPMGDLPGERLQHHQHPFTCAAVDYFGPMQVTIGRRVEKRWGALFTCLTTRAVHLELVNSLSTSSMIMALRRMSARRGTPKIIFSDNGTNFIGANRELEEAAREKGIKWKFIPPGSPNMGGAWERLVRSVKTALSAVLHERNPPEEVLHTLMTEVEHVVNSRPLTPVSMDPEDEESLTPNHFLLGRSCGAMAPGEFSDSELIGKPSWRTVQRLADHFWQRWIKEYLPLLMPRKIEGRETTDPKEGDIVLIVDATLPRNSWPRGEVIKTYPGPDGRTRILDVRTSGGVLRRPTRRVVVLVPASSSRQEDGVLRTAGENVSDD